MSETRPKSPKPALLSGSVAVVNVGLERFAIELAAQGVKVTHVDWVPPARGNAKLAELLSKLGS